MDNYYSHDHFAREHIQTDTVSISSSLLDITTCNIKESQKKYRLWTVSNKLLGMRVIEAATYTSFNYPTLLLLFWVKRPFETVFQSISGRLSERGRKKRERTESKSVQTIPIRTYCKRKRSLTYYYPTTLEVYPGPSHHPTDPFNDPNLAL